MYDALNKGIRIASGDLIGFLNTDDTYEPGVFSEIQEAFNSHPEMDVVWGKADLIKVQGDEKIRLLRSYDTVPHETLLQGLLFGVPCFNACFFRKRVFDQFGLLWADLKIASDREFMIRLALAGCKIHRLDQVVYHYLAHDDSLTFTQSPIAKARMAAEEVKIAGHYLNSPNLTALQKRLFQKWHSAKCLAWAFNALQTGDFHQTSQALKLGFQRNPGLVFSFHLLGWHYHNPQ